MSMNRFKKSGKRIFLLIILLFVCNVFYILKLTTIDKIKISTNSYNPRISYTDDRVNRGTIYDINLNILAETQSINNVYVRKYPYGNIGSHVIGYNSISKAGIESHENFTLQKISDEIIQRFKNIVLKEEIVCDSVVLTVDENMQKAAKEALGKNKGSIVAIEPDTGRIIAMVSYPDYNPSKVFSEWDELRTNEESPLLNRAVNGVYTPGSTFKIVTALAAMRSDKINLDSFTYKCVGEAKFTDKVIHCYNNKAHGEVDLKYAMAYSCNCYFAELAKIIGAEQLKNTAESLGINNEITMELGSSKSSFLMTKDCTESELVETAIGQGKTGATPLYMATLISAIANDGVMMQPYIVDRYIKYTGKEYGQNIPEKISTIMTEEEAKKLQGLLVDAVTLGTGSAAAINGWETGGKTGTAENPKGTDHSWFVGFSPAEDPKIAVAVVLENPKSNAKAAPIASKIFKAYKNIIE